MCKCEKCGYDVQNVVISLTDAYGTRHLCPNCVVRELILGTLSFTSNMSLVDDVTGLPGAVAFVSGDEKYTLYPRRMLRLLAHDLRPDEWKVLAEKYGPQQFMLHDDFYDEDGNAYQHTLHVRKYTWRDIVEINGKHYAEEFEISGEVDCVKISVPEDEDSSSEMDVYFHLGDFYAAVAQKHGVDTDDIKTYMMDDINFNPQQMPYGAEECGCYYDGVAEWLLPDEEFE